MNTTSRSRTSRFALAGIAMPIAVLGYATLLGLAQSGYDPFRNAISELGASGSPNQLAWQVGGFAVAAVLQLVYALALRDEFGMGWLCGLTLATAAGLAVMTVSPCDAGCPPVPRSPTMAVHTVTGLAVFAIFFLLPIVGWWTFRRRPAWSSLARPSLVVGLGLVVGFLASPAFGPDRIGTWERGYIVLFSAWQIAVAWRLHRLSIRRRTPAAEWPQLAGAGR
jgi:hypothetical membrane protein